VKRHILVVDDEEAIRSLFESLFPEDVYDVHTVRDGLEALQLLKESTINVIFLDLKLFGMDGITLCRQIRQTNPDAIIHAMTGWSVLYDLEECRATGFDDYFVKPLDIDLILSTVQESFQKLDRWRQKSILPSVNPPHSIQ
jgi:CheY-like chemotaxis protein